MAASAVRRLTLGVIGLPVLLDRDALGSVDQPPAPLGDLIVIDRAEQPSVGDNIVSIDSPTEVERHLRAIAARDLRWVESEARGWEHIARRTVDCQVAILLASMANASASARVLVVPPAWDATRAIGAVAREVGIE